MTPHNNANIGDFASVVLMPGDPLRAKYISDNFLINSRLVNSVRGINGYSGEYKNTPISVMASGMGMPSMAIYSEELFSVYGVNAIIRVGSAGALKSDIKVRDIVIAGRAITDSNIIEKLGGSMLTEIMCDPYLLPLAEKIAAQRKLNAFKGTVFSTDAFYAPKERTDSLAKISDAVEMECAALYAIAGRLNKRALGICTISDNVITGESLSAEERQTSFNEMISLALDTAANVHMSNMQH